MVLHSLLMVSLGCPPAASDAGSVRPPAGRADQEHVVQEAGGASRCEAHPQRALHQASDHHVSGGHQAVGSSLTPGFILLTFFSPGFYKESIRRASFSLDYDYYISSLTVIHIFSVNNVTFFHSLFLFCSFYSYFL